MNNSYWDDEFLNYDVAVVGGGLIGINTAIELAERNSGLRIVVLERGVSPIGASTRNAGFACFGSVSEIHYDLRTHGMEHTFNQVFRRVTGLQKLMDRCRTYDVGYENHGGCEVIVRNYPGIPSSHSTPSSADLDVMTDEVNTLLLSIFSEPAFQRIDHSGFGFGRFVQDALYTKYESTLHSGKLVGALWHLAGRMGISIRTGCDVESVQLGSSQGAPQHALQIKDTHQGVMASKVVLCTNAGIPALLNASSGEDITLKSLPFISPGRGQIITTSPLSKLPFAGSFHMDSGFYYFRNVGNRVLLGGGRNTDFEGEKTVSLETSRVIQEHLEQICRDIVLPDADFTIEQRWAGTMGFSVSKQPIVESVADGVVVAFGCNGMGVAIGASVAELAARKVG